MEPPGPRQQHRILLVDDEPPLRKMMSIYLERRGYQVTASGSTDEASALAEGEPLAFSVAVLDATMAGLGMNALAQKLLSLNPSLRVVVVSGYPVDMSVLSAAAPGRATFLHKPFTPEMLVETVRRMLAAEEEAGV